jgi:hypothetical protein
MLRFRRFKPRSLEQVLHPDPENLYVLSPQDLARFIAGWKPGSENWLLGQAEQRRREQWSGPVRLALFLSFAALVVSVIALAKR